MPSVVTTSAAGAEGLSARDRRSRFFVGMSVLLMLLVLVGFARTFFLRPFFGGGFSRHARASSPSVLARSRPHGVVLAVRRASVPGNNRPH